MEKLLLKSILEHTSGILGVSNIRISAKQPDLNVHAVTDDDLVYCYLTYNKPTTVLDTDVFGLNRLQLLTGLVKSDIFDTIDLKRKQDDTLSTLLFSGGKNSSSYRVVSKNIVDSTFQKVPTLKQIKYDISFCVTPELVKKINQFSSLFSNVIDTFTISVDNGAVLFNYGEDDNARLHVTDTNNQYTAKVSFNCQSFSSLLKICLSHDSHVIQISSLGAIVIYAEDTIGEYTYVLRATK